MSAIDVIVKGRYKKSIQYYQHIETNKIENKSRPMLNIGYAKFVY